MDLNYPKGLMRLGLVLVLLSVTGCVAPETAVPTVWQRLGIPQAGAALRDGLVNRRGNFPGLEKKPPLLALADPANLEPEKPEMIKAAAEIKQDQDLKRQKIKAIKFLAQVNCGCYNQDDKVEAAFLAALDDCDPDVRTAAIEGLSEAAGECMVCRTGCEVTCCTKKMLEKLEEIANGMEDGCYKEPVPEIRQAARAVVRRCPPPPFEPEELIAPDPERLKEDMRLREEEVDSVPQEQAQAKDPRSSDSIAYHLNDFSYGDVDPQPVVIDIAYERTIGDRQSVTDDSATVAKASSLSLTVGGKENEETASAPEGDQEFQKIVNPELMVQSRVVNYRRNLGEVLIQLPQTYELDNGWTAILVDENGNHSLAEIIEIGGRRILLAIESTDALLVDKGSTIRLGVVTR